MTVVIGFCIAFFFSRHVNASDVITETRASCLCAGRS